jgi:hypothetical protein
MSNRHPNFNASQFTVDVTTAYFNALKGPAITLKPSVTSQIVDFVTRIEDIVDNDVASNTKMSS